MKFKKKEQTADSTLQLNMIYAYEETKDNPMSIKVLKGETEESHVKEMIEKLI